MIESYEVFYRKLARSYRRMRMFSVAFVVMVPAMIWAEAIPLNGSRLRWMILLELCTFIAAFSNLRDCNEKAREHDAIADRYAAEDQAQAGR